MIILDFHNFLNYVDQPNAVYPRADRNAWKRFILLCCQQYPNIISKPNKGNGTNTTLLGYLLKATSAWSLYITPEIRTDKPNVTFAINYNIIKQIAVYDDCFIINGIMAVKKAN